MTIKSNLARFGAFIATALVSATAIPMAAHAVVISDGNLLVDIRSDNGAIDTVLYKNRFDFFNPGDSVSDWGLRVNGAFGSATTTGGGVITTPMVSTNGTNIQARGSFGGIFIVRSYSLVPGQNTLRVRTTLRNMNSATANVVLWDAYDPDQDEAFTSATVNDVDGGQAIASGVNQGLTSILSPSTAGNSLGFLASLGIFSDSDLTAFLSGPIDPNGASADIGYAVAWERTLSPNQSANLQYDHIFIPEPGTLAIFGLGLAGLGFARRRKAA